MLAPYVQIKAGQAGISVASVNIDDVPEVAAKYKITTTPTYLVILSNGSIQHQ